MHFLNRNFKFFPFVKEMSFRNQKFVFNGDHLQTKSNKVISFSGWAQAIHFFVKMSNSSDNLLGQQANHHDISGKSLMTHV